MYLVYNWIVKKNLCETPWKKYLLFIFMKTKTHGAVKLLDRESFQLQNIIFPLNHCHLLYISPGKEQKLACQVHISVALKAMSLSLLYSASKINVGGMVVEIELFYTKPMIFFVFYW